MSERKPEVQWLMNASEIESGKMSMRKRPFLGSARPSTCATRCVPLSTLPSMMMLFVSRSSAIFATASPMCAPHMRAESSRTSASKTGFENTLNSFAQPVSCPPTEKAFSGSANGISSPALMFARVTSSESDIRGEATPFAAMTCDVPRILKPETVKDVSAAQ